MNDLLILTLALVEGLLLGTVFFGGLWWTVSKGISSEHPATWLFASLLLRMSIALAGFYFVGHLHWERMGACLVGFVIARFLVMQVTASWLKHRGSAATEASHAP